jgi:hypothetical protein
MVQRFLALCLLFYSLTSASASWAQTKSNETIDQMIAALGGPAFLDVKDIRTNGRLFTFSHGDLSSSDLFSDYIKFPDMERTEFGTLNRKTITINRGKEGWKIVGKRAAEAQAAAEAEEFLKGFQTSFDYVLRFVINERQTTVQKVGAEIIDFKRVDVVEVRDPEKNLFTFYIDRDAHLPLKMQVRRTGESKVREEQYNNWHRFQGVMIPAYVSRLTDGVKSMEIHLDTAAFNSGLSDNLFAPPTSKK